MQEKRQKNAIHPTIIKKEFTSHKVDTNRIKSAIINALISNHHLIFSASEKQVNDK